MMGLAVEPGPHPSRAAGGGNRHLQREDLRGMVVHHKDGDRASLKLDNLEIRESGQ